MFDQDVNELIFQLENDIYHHGSEPERDIECYRFEYTFFVFTKYNPNSNEEWEFPDLLHGWQWIGGGSFINHLEWRENQFSGRGLENLYSNEMLVRSRLNEYKSRGILEDFKIRYRYMTLI